MLKGFKEFVMRGNVVDLAVAVAIGTAFTAVVDQFGKSFIKPLVGLAGGGSATGGSFTIRGQVFDWSGFVNAVIFFLITAAVIYAVIVVPMRRIQQRRAAGQTTPEEQAALPADVQLLTEIRDLLRQRDGGR